MVNNLEDTLTKNLLVIDNSKSPWFAYVRTPLEAQSYNIGYVSSLPEAVKIADKYCNQQNTPDLKPVRWICVEDVVSLPISGPRRY